MPMVNIQEAKTHLSRLLERVRRGETITIAKAGLPIAELRPVPRADLQFGTFAGAVSVDYDVFDSADADISRMWDESLEVTE